MKPGTPARVAALAIVMHTPAAVPKNITQPAADTSSRKDTVGEVYAFAAEIARVLEAIIAAGQDLMAAVVAGAHAGGGNEHGH